MCCVWPLPRVESTDTHEVVAVSSEDAGGQANAGHGAGVWEPGINPRRYCQACGAEVSPDIGRVCGDNDGLVHGCPECTTWENIFKGGAADIDQIHRIPGGEQ